MTQGVLIYAFNNEKIDYCKIAIEAARRASLFLKLPVTIVTDSLDHVNKLLSESRVPIDRVIDYNGINLYSNVLRRYNDGSLKQDRLSFKNQPRTQTFDISPYTETLVIDGDYFIANEVLKNCFEQPKDFLIWQKGIDLSRHRDTSEFNRLSETTIDFYWATVFFFRKTPDTRIFFELVDFVKDNWNYFKFVYRFDTPIFRNDHAFSIAIHIINGFKKSNWEGKLPGTLFYTTDKDILIDMTDSTFKFLIEKENVTGEYTLLKTSEINVHIMNKFSISRIIND